jgi:hypothetical protein
MTASRTEHATSSRSATQAPEPEPASEPSGRLGVSGVQVAASVMASVSAATVASFFGVAGTIIGAAVVSVFATVGSAAYGLGLRRTQARLQQVQTLRLPRLSSWPVGVTGATRSIGDDGTHANGSGRGGDELDGDPASDGEADGDGTVVDDDLAGGAAPDAATAWREWLSERRWALAGGAALVFVLSLAAITLVEAVTDRPLSGRDSGRATSIGSLLTSSGGDVDDPVEVDDGRRAPTTVEGEDSPTPPVTGDDESPSPGVAEDPGTSPTTTAPPGTTTPTTSPPATSPPATSPPTTTAPEAVEPEGGSAAPAPTTTAPPPG